MSHADASQDQRPSPEALSRAGGARVAVLMHYLPPYQLEVLRQLSSRVGALQVFLSTPMEPNRQWEPHWGDLDVRVQRGFTFRRKWRHREAGFVDDAFIHVPTDTLQRVLSAQPDVIVSFELGARTLSALALSGVGRRRGLVVTTWMSEYTERGRGPARAAARRLIVRGADVVTYNGPSCRRYLSSIGAPAQRLHHLPYAPSPAALWDGPVEREPERARRLLYVGQLAERKGVLPMLDELERFAARRPAEPIHLEMVGAGPLADAVRARRMPPNLHVELRGSLTAARLREVYGQAGVLVFPSLADEWGLVVNEAMWAGLPVIGSCRSQAVETLCEHGRTGLVFDPQRAGGLCAGLEALWELSPAELSAMRQAARQAVQGLDARHAGDQMFGAVARALRAPRAGRGAPR